MKKSPQDAQCPHCKRFFTKRGLREHLRHVRCSPTSTATKRVFKRARCKRCGKSFHSGNSLRVHVAGQHPAEYAQSPHSVKGHKAPLKRKGIVLNFARGHSWGFLSLSPQHPDNLPAGGCLVFGTDQVCSFFKLPRDGRKSNGAQHASYCRSSIRRAECIIASIIDPAREHVSCAARMIYPDHGWRESAVTSVFQDL